MIKDDDHLSGLSMDWAIAWHRDDEETLSLNVDVVNTVWVTSPFTHGFF
jgi:hypothetical protein